MHDEGDDSKQLSAQNSLSKQKSGEVGGGDANNGKLQKSQSLTGVDLNVLQHQISSDKLQLNKENGIMRK